MFQPGAVVRITFEPKKRSGATVIARVTHVDTSLRLGATEAHVCLTFKESGGKEDTALLDADTAELIANPEPDGIEQTLQTAPPVEAELFEHGGVTWRVKRSLNKGEDIKPGMWIRLTYDPYDSKEPKIAEVLSSTESGNNDYRIIVARYGYPAERRNLDFSDGPFEEVEELDTMNSQSRIS
jgi:hypothetical protein